MSRLVPAIPITLDPANPKEQRLLKCDFNALALIKEWTGLNAFKGDNVLRAEIFEATNSEEKLVKAISVDPLCLRAVLAALFFQDDETMTPVKAGKLINAENYVEVMTKCSESVNSFFPERKKKDADNTEGAPESPLAQTTPSTSPISGPSPDTISASQTPSSGA